MVATPLKRNASHSPEGSRHPKRLLTSSPEEGELDEPNPPLSPTTPTIPLISLPPKPVAPSTAKVPFPFKKKADVLKPAPAPLNVFEGRTREDKSRGLDHWEPAYGRGNSHFSRAESYESFGRNDQSWDSRDRKRSPVRSSYPSTRSRSPASPQYRSRRSTNSYSPSSPRAFEKSRDRSRERGYDIRHRERWEDDSRRFRRRDLSGGDDRHYRPASSNDYRKDDRDWSRKSYGYGRYDCSSHWSPSRPRPRSPSTRSEPLSPRPPTSTEPRSPPPPGTVSRDSGPRPPSSSPPPAPPPDPRLSKPPPSEVAPPANQLPALPPPIKIPPQRPNAPKNVHSPVSLELRSAISTAGAMAHGIETQIDNTQSQSQHPPPPPLLEPPRDQIPAKKDFKVSGHPLIQSLRSKACTRRTQKEEMQLYGHGFTGCGRQEDYETTTKLGEGTFGEVHKAIHKPTGTIVALKRILMHNEKEGMPVTALREIKILKALKHQSVVNILDMFVVRSKDDHPLSVYMVFPYMDHDLAGLLENERVKLQPSHIKLYMKQLLEGTAYMHQNHILHRDMKAANLLISNNGTLKIADFGLARSFDSSVSDNGPCNNNGTSGAGGGKGRDKKYTNCVVTRWYRPPELLLGARHYGGEVDIWGIGCVLGEMFTRKPILPGSSDLDQLEKIWSLCGSPNQHNWPYFDQLPGCEGIIRFNNQPRRLKSTYESVGPETVDLLDQLLRINPKERLTAATALEHDYFWTDPLPADPKTMPSYEASHEFDKRGHRPHQPPQMPARPPGPQHQRRYGVPQGNNPRFNNRGPRHGGPGPDSRQQGLRPPAGPPGHGQGGHRPSSQAQAPPQGPHHPSHPHPHPASLPPPPNALTGYPVPGPGGYHGGPPPGMMPNMPPAQMYGPNASVPPPPMPPPIGLANSFGPPPSFPHGHGAPYPPGTVPGPGVLPLPPYAPNAPPCYGPPPQSMIYPGSHPHHGGHSRRPQGGRGRWEHGQRNHRDGYNYSGGGQHQNGLPKPPPGLPLKPMPVVGIGSRSDNDAASSGTRPAGGEDRFDESEGLSYG